MSADNWPEAPWFRTKKRQRICAQDGQIVAQVFVPPHRLTKDKTAEAWEQSNAAANLIVAAPELFHALENLVAEIGVMRALASNAPGLFDGLQPELDAAELALSKASEAE